MGGIGGRLLWRHIPNFQGGRDVWAGQGDFDAGVGV